MDNCLATTKNLLISLNVQHSISFLEDCLLSHPEYPSILSVSDTLKKYEVDCLVLRIDSSKLEDLPKPAIVQISITGINLFHVLLEFSNEKAVYLNDKNGLVENTRDDFLAMWTGIYLMPKTSELSAEPNIDKVLAKRKIRTLSITATAIFLTLWFLIELLKLATVYTAEIIFFAVFYAIVKLLGLATATMLLWYEVDRYNPVLRSICSGHKKVDCDSVLSSRYANIINGQLSLSSLAFAYFFGSFCYLLFNHFSIEFFSIMAFLSFATLPCIMASFFYQFAIIKQWCKFCIAIQVILVAEIITALGGSFHLQHFRLDMLPMLISLLIIPVIVWKWLKPLLENEKEAKLVERELNRIKGNPNVFQGLLAKTRKIRTKANNLGIIIKNEKAKFNVLKVCNPYCGPCSKAHLALEELVNDKKDKSTNNL